MKKLLYILLFISNLFCFAQNIYFPDANLKSKLLLASTQNQTAFSFNVIGNSKIDLNNDGEISQIEALQVESLFLNGSNITNLTGIEFFINIITLRVANNQLTTLNLGSNLANLEYLQLDFNGLVNEDFSVYPKLKGVSCSYNQFMILDFSNNPQFEYLGCSNNGNLISINIKNGKYQLINVPQYLNDCWKIGNPNLTTICADENEVAPLTTFLASCNSAAQPTIDSSCVLASEQFVKNEFLFFPNPASSIVNFNFNGIVNDNINGNFNLELIDIHGRVLQSQNVSNSQTSLDISALDKGIYFLKMKYGNRIQIQRIIKE